MTLAHNVHARADVYRLIEEAGAAGARISRQPAETFYGGYAVVFVDPDGHPWEVAHNPGFELTGRWRSSTALTHDERPSAR
jgi:uncharacterized protein